MRHNQHSNAKRRPILKWFIGIVVLALVAFWFFAYSTMPNYSRLAEGNKIAQVCITTTHVPGKMSVQVILFASNGNQTGSTRTLINGDTLQLHGDIIAYPTLTTVLNTVGLYSGYKLTALEGYSKDGSQAPQSFTLNDDDAFFTAMYKVPNPLAQASYNSSSFLSASSDGNTYNIFLSQTGVHALKIAGQPKCGLTSNS